MGTYFVFRAEAIRQWRKRESEWEQERLARERLMKVVRFKSLDMVMVMVEFNVIQASILEGWLFHPYGRTSRFGAKSPAPLYYRSSNGFAITFSLIKFRNIIRW